MVVYAGLPPAIPLWQDERDKKNKFIHWLRSNGFMVVTKDGAPAEEGHYKANVDVMMAIDALELSVEMQPEVVILVTGDADFAYLATKLRRRGIRVEVASVAQNLGGVLKAAANAVIDLAPLFRTFEIMAAPESRPRRGASARKRGPDLLEVVSLDQTHAGRAVFPLHDDGVGAGRERSHDRRFPVVGWRQAGRFDLAFLRPLPIVVARDERAVRIPQIEHGIGQRVGDSGQARPDCAHDHLGRAGAGIENDETADHDVVARLDEAAGGDVCQRRSSVETVGFDQPDAGPAILPLHHRRVSARGQSPQNRRLLRVGRRDGRAFDLGLSGFPANCRLSR